MKKKLNNPFINLPEHKCICCSKGNPIGLKLDFWLNDKDKTVETHWIPDELFQGYPNILHGGIQSTIMDEIASWCIYVLQETAGVTMSMEISYKKPVQISAGEITVIGKILSIERRTTTIHAELFDGNGNLCSEGKIKYFTYPQQKAINELNYPGILAF